MTAGMLAKSVFAAGLILFVAAGPTRAAANGHDSVGGLMPLPLWPSTGASRMPAPAKSAHALAGVRHPGRLRR
jgi:hypothetical protein